MLDTNVLIDAAEGRAPKALDRIERGERGSMVISAVTLAELERGWRAGQGKAAEKEVFLAYLDVLPFGEPGAAAFGDLMAAGRRTKATFDRLIAGHAMSLGLILITSDRKGFASIEGLSVEDWSA